MTSEPLFAAIALAVLFVLLWLAVVALLAVGSGWRRLARCFPAREGASGERFRFASAYVGAGALPVRYRNCLDLTVGDEGIAVQVNWLFRFRHPALFLPWSAVARCERRRRWLLEQTVIEFAGLDNPFAVTGSAGDAILLRWRRHAAG